ncbi:hypothetical protein [Saccharibacter floricola]|uniref:Uncharacterized protein n=1 Tax=Saccharibacter floricola DSM 15669 TaxID=1123227 RepID=A0ABQ0P153_9PROT|nr:hypothetical protein [Saccharibacter floricola]GBQ08861.1 hypothetical protein AA15669_1938 [Saccharibacter floricola DSM 15669]
MIRKHYVLTLLVVTFFTIGTPLAQPGTIYAPGETPIGRFSSDGTITGSNGVFLGTLNDAGTIYAPGETPIGRFSSGGTITGSNGNFLGTLDDSGTIYAPGNTPIGRVDRNGYVTGKGGIYVGQVPDPRIGALMVLHVINMQ